AGDHRAPRRAIAGSAHRPQGGARDERPTRDPHPSRGRRRHLAALNTMKRIGTLALAAAAALATPAAPRAQTAGTTLSPTRHVRLPADPAQYWLAPGATDARTAKSPAMTQFADAVKQEVDGNFARALPVFSQKALQQGPLGDYALYYQGLAELRMGRPADAK